MKTSIARYLAGASTGLLLGSLLQGQSMRESSSGLPDQFRVLTQRSIFSREPVRAPRTRDFYGSFDRAASSPVLTGVVQDQDDFIAFIEDPTTRKVNLVRVGEPLGDGTVEDMTLDYILLRVPGSAEPRRIDVGHTLSGAARATVAATAPGDATRPAGETAASPTDDLLERLRKKRQAELQGK